MPQAPRAAPRARTPPTAARRSSSPTTAPSAAAIVELRVSRTGGITRYKLWCTGNPPCRLVTSDEIAALLDSMPTSSPPVRSDSKPSSSASWPTSATRPSVVAARPHRVCRRRRRPSAARTCGSARPIACWSSWPRSRRRTSTRCSTRAQPAVGGVDRRRRRDSRPRPIDQVAAFERASVPADGEEGDRRAAARRAARRSRCPKRARPCRSKSRSSTTWRRSTSTRPATGLHKRGYRTLAAEAQLRETLAAAMVQLSFWRPSGRSSIRSAARARSPSKRR